VGRIEDAEAERAERALQERKLAEKQLRTKQLAEHEQFQSFVAKASEGKRQDGQADQHKQELGQDARKALLARRGIDANQGQSVRFHEGQADNAVNRKRLLAAQAERNKQRDGLAQAGDKANQSSSKSTSMGIGRGAGKQNDEGASQRRDGKKGEAERGAGAGTAQSFAAIGQAAVQALDGMGARAGRSQSVDAADSVRKMLEEIVKSVRQGVDQHGFGLMQITLNDDVLNGTTLTVLSSQQGIHLKVDTGETGQRRSDRPIESLLVSSATELSHAMTAAKVPLIGLEVNGEKVIA
jgi:hypothetical protein